MVNSKDKTDRRLIDILRVQQASRQGIRFGFKGLNFEEHEKFRLKGPNAKDEEFFEVSFYEEDSDNSLNNNKKKTKDDDKARTDKISLDLNQALQVSNINWLDT